MTESTVSDPLRSSVRLASSLTSPGSNKNNNKFIRESTLKERRSRRGGTFDDVGSLPLERLDGLLLGEESVLAHQDFDVEVFAFENFQGDDVTEATGGADEEDVLGKGHSLGSRRRRRSRR